MVLRSQNFCSKCDHCYRGHCLNRSLTHLYCLDYSEITHISSDRQFGFPSTVLTTAFRAIFPKYKSAHFASLCSQDKLSYLPQHSKEPPVLAPACHFWQDLCHFLVISYLWFPLRNRVCFLLGSFPLSPGKSLSFKIQIVSLLFASFLAWPFPPSRLYYSPPTHPCTYLSPFITFVLEGLCILVLTCAQKWWCLEGRDGIVLRVIFVYCLYS